MFQRVVEEKLDCAIAILGFTIIILVWTLIVIPLSIGLGSTFVTPMPLGPLVALNILPWIEKSGNMLIERVD
jgi:hypothetical protein